MNTYMTCSLGISTVIPLEKMTPKQFVAMADQRLYQAKAQGRNQYLISSLSSLPKARKNEPLRVHY